MKLIKNPYIAWLTQAEIDLKTAGILFEHGQHGTAAFHFQQAVEKACKFWGLSQGLISEGDAQKSISHNPHKIFRKIFAQDELKPFNGESEFDKLYARLVSVSNMDDRVQAICGHLYVITSNAVIPRLAEQTARKALIDYNSGKTSKCLVNERLDTLLREDRGDLSDDFYENFIIDTENICKTPACLMMLSFLVFGTEQNTRYPGDSSPAILYNADTIYMQQFQLFCNLLGHCLECLNAYFQEINN